MSIANLPAADATGRPLAEGCRVRIVACACNDVPLILLGQRARVVALSPHGAVWLRVGRERRERRVSRGIAARVLVRERGR